MLINNEYLTNITAFKNTTYIYDLTIENIGVNDLEGLENIEDLDLLHIINNKSLKSISNLNGIKNGHANEIEIINNDSLVNLHGLENLQI